MFLITTPTGNSGRHVLAATLAGGHKVRVLVRDPKRLSVATRAACEVIAGDLRDVSTLRKAAEGVEAAFFCTPQSANADDIPAYYRSFALPAAKCFAEAGLRRVVTISGGRGNPEDLGPGGPLAAMERSFDATGVATRHVRCGYFMENFLYMIPQLKFKGSFSLPLSPDYPLAVQAAEDIGSTAANWLMANDWTGQQGVYVPFGQVLSCSEIAHELARGLGKKIAFTSVSGAEYKAMLVKYGVSEAMGQCLKEMFEGVDHESISGANRTAQGGVSLFSWVERSLAPEFGIVKVIRRVLASK